jgi:PAS domain S-box-containing protein
MKVRILVVDDNENNLYLMETLLKGSGYKPVLAANGEEALQKLRASPFDMIISDILMPNMDGFQLCRECKGDPDLKSIPFLVCTATYTDDKDEKLAMTLGADEYVRKPVDPDELIAIVQQLLVRGESSSQPAAGPAAAKQQALSLYNQRLVEKLEGKMLDLDASRIRYHNLWTNVTDLVFSLDEERRIIEINHSREMLGCEPEEAVGRSLLEFLTIQSRKDVERRMTRSAQTGKSRRHVYEVTIAKKDGGVLIAELSLSTKYVNNRFFGEFGIARDITARKKAEEALKTTASELRKQKKALQEKNAALKEILAQIETERTEISRRVDANVTELVMPILRKLKRDPSNVDIASLNLLESTLSDVTSGFASGAGRGTNSLTLRQIEICNMIRSGMTSKDIACQLGVSLRTVETHRNNIRKKLGISGEDANLASYLQSLQ